VGAAGRPALQGVQTREGGEHAGSGSAQRQCRWSSSSRTKQTVSRPQSFSPPLAALAFAAPRLYESPCTSCHPSLPTASAAVRMPDGQRKQRRFPPSATVEALYDFCLSQSEEAAGGRKFSLAQFGPGALAPSHPAPQARPACWSSSPCTAILSEVSCLPAQRASSCPACQRSHPPVLPSPLLLLLLPLQAPSRRWRTGSRRCRMRGCTAPCWCSSGRTEACLSCSSLVVRCRAKRGALVCCRGAAARGVAAQGSSTIESSAAAAAALLLGQSL